MWVNCALFVSNLQAIIIKEMNEETQQKHKECKYQYKINNNISFGLLKDRIVELFLNESPEVVLDKIKGLLIQNVIPIRPNRQFKRQMDKYRTRKKPIITKNFKRSL